VLSTVRTKIPFYRRIGFVLRTKLSGSWVGGELHDPRTPVGWQSRFLPYGTPNPRCILEVWERFGYSLEPANDLGMNAVMLRQGTALKQNYGAGWDQWAEHHNMGQGPMALDDSFVHAMANVPQSCARTSFLWDAEYLDAPSIGMGVFTKPLTRPADQVPTSCTVYLDCAVFVSSGCTYDSCASHSSSARTPPSRRLEQVLTWRMEIGFRYRTTDGARVLTQPPSFWAGTAEDRYRWIASQPEITLTLRRNATPGHLLLELSDIRENVYGYR
jgi:hypothetical protein